MQKLVDIAPGETMLSGIALETDNEEVPVFASGENVVPDNGGLSRYIGATLIDSVVENLQFSLQHFTTVPQLVVLGNRNAWRWTGGAVSLISPGTPMFQQDGAVTGETWGTWVIANNNKEKPRVWKNTDTWADLAGVNFNYCVEMIRRQPYILALGTLDPVTVSWCDTSNPEIWTPLPSNAAGDFTIRDIPGAIMGGCPLGEATAIYSRESLTIATYLGPPNYFGFTTVLSGIGLYGPKSVCAVDRRNFGLGPQGPFLTDGYSFELIGNDALRKWIAKHIDTAKPHEIVVFHNELLEAIEFRWVSKDGLSRGFLYKLGSQGQVFPLTLALGSATERDVFDTAFVTIGNRICKLERADSWAGLPILGKLGTKFTDAGQEGIDKIWQLFRLDGTLAGLNVKAEAVFYDPNSQDETILRVHDAPALRQNYIEGGGVESLKMRLLFEGTSAWHLSRIQAYGDLTDPTI